MVVVADAAYDTSKFIKEIEHKQMTPVIPNHPLRKIPRKLDHEIYSFRYTIENCIHDLKRFRRVATRFEKRGRNFLAFVHLACWVICLAKYPL